LLFLANFDGYADSTDEITCHLPMSLIEKPWNTHAGNPSDGRAKTKIFDDSHTHHGGRLHLAAEPD
jgi:hypothetical protein